MNIGIYYLSMWIALFVYIHTIPKDDDSFRMFNHNISIFVLSRRSSFELRKTIRRTWGKHLENRHFFVGRQVCQINNKIDYCEDNLEGHQLNEEIKSDKDIHVLQMSDTYKNLPQKMHLIFRWGIRHTTSTWFLKIDEDTVVIPATLNALLSKYVAQNKVMGCLRLNTSVERFGKWAEMYYPSQTYPPFVLGSCGYILSRDVVEFVADRKNWFYYQGEDTSLGIWLNETNYPVQWVNIPEMQNNFKFSLCKQPNGMMQKVTTLVTWGHDITWKHLDSCFLRYINNKKINRLFVQNFTSIFSWNITRKYEEHLFNAFTHFHS